MRRKPWFITPLKTALTEPLTLRTAILSKGQESGAKLIL